MGYLTHDAHYPWKVPPELWSYYKSRYPDLGADNPAYDDPKRSMLGPVTLSPERQEVIERAKDNGPAKPARKPRARTSKTTKQTGGTT
jgi:hypothetical protein